MKKLPKNLYVKIERPDNDEPYFVADVDLTGFVDVGQKITVGVYKLIATHEIEGMVQMRKARPVR